MPSNDQGLTKVFSNLLEEYVSSISNNVNEITEVKYNQDVDLEKEFKLISEFLSKPCPCGKDCQTQFSFNEIWNARADFRLLTKNEKNCFILSQLKVFKRSSGLAKSGRCNKIREKQKFEYHISIDRPVCRNVFFTTVKALRD